MNEKDGRKFIKKQFENVSSRLYGKINANRVEQFKSVVLNKGNSQTFKSGLEKFCLFFVDGKMKQTREYINR